MKVYEDLTFKDAKDVDIKRKMQILMEIQPWEPC